MGDMGDVGGIDARFRLDWTGFSLDVDLHLPGRGVTALFGNSGSGKTTVLRCIAGLERAPQGRLSVHGEVWQDDAPRGRWLPPHQRPIGYVFQEASLFAHLSVLGNLRYGVKRMLVTQAQRVSLDQAIALLGIEPLLERKPDRLSGGERQRVGIARALAVSPRLLLMDEPLAALDVQRKQEILPYLERLHDALDIPVLYVSHAADEVARLADHIVALEDGKVRAAGPLKDVLSNIDLPIHLGEDAGVVLQAQVVARDAQWHLVRVAFPGGSLWVRDGGQPLGQTVRVRILARDVSLALAPVHGTSILNSLPATVDHVAADHHPALALVRLVVGDAAGSAALLARLSQRSATGLQLAPGQAVWVQIKAVAVVG